MKKISYIAIGVVIGVILSSSVGAFAATTSLLGKPVQKLVNVTVNGKTLDTQGAIIDGTTMVPVRALGSAVGLDSKYDPKVGVQLTDLPNVVNTDISIDAKIDLIKRQIKQLELSINAIKEQLSNIDVKDKETLQKRLEEKQNNLDGLNAQLKELEAQAASK